VSFVSSSSLSATGRYVAFSSFASNLVTGDTNGQFDVFIHDRVTGMTELVSVSSDEVQGDALSVAPTVSRNGRYVASWSDATNLVPGDTNTCPLFFEDPGTCPDIFVRTT
jgi:hypothetical protein